MILQALDELYGRLESESRYGIAPLGFSSQKIGFRIVLKPNGTLFDIEDARSPDGKGKLQNTVLQVPGDAKPSGAGINPGFLWDNQTYLLGRQPEDKKEGFGRERFEASRARHLENEAQIDCPEFSAVCRFLEQWEPERIEAFPILNNVGTGFGVFQIQGEKNYVHDCPKILDWWGAHQSKPNSSTLAQCLITGEIEAPIARLHPKIKSVTGAQSAGASIVSFNDTAYESYGKSQSFNSPVSEDAAFRYGSALNALLSGPMSKKHRLRIGDTTCVFWTDKASQVEDIFSDMLGGGSHARDEAQDETQRARIQRFLTALRSGGGFRDDLAPLNTPFYILGIAPNAARLSIRFFHRSTIAELVEKLSDHQHCLEIVREFENPIGKRYPDREFPAVWQLLNQTARVSDEVPPLLGGALARAIVEGTPYPEGLLSAVIRRIRADRNIHYLRAALIKAILVRNHKTNISIMLDTNQTEPAYLLGRLFSALEKTQEDALGGNLNTSIRDRYYSSASATPASVFPRILRTYQHHLAKLQGGTKVNREKLVQEIVASISSSGFPTQLNLKAQGLFAIGYYHQRKDFFTSKPKTAPEA
jgi:CRISPR-associated protein Csd1